MKRRWLPGLAAALCCAGCVNSALTSHADAPQVYRLVAPDRATSSAGTSTLPAGLSIGRPRAPPSLDTERVAVVQPGSGFDYFAGVRWADPAPQMLQQLLAQAITADGRFATTVVAPSRVPAEYALDLELRRFEAVYAAADAPPAVRVSVQATLVDARNGVRVVSFQADSSAAATANRRDAIIAAFQQATATTVGDIVSRLRDGTANIR